jgi:hypothetical protein
MPGRFAFTEKNIFRLKLDRLCIIRNQSEMVRPHGLEKGCLGMAVSKVFIMIVEQM